MSELQLYQKSQLDAETLTKYFTHLQNTGELREFYSIRELASVFGVNSQRMAQVIRRFESDDFVVYKYNNRQIYRVIPIAIIPLTLDSMGNIVIDRNV